MFQPSPRLQKLAERARALAKSGKRNMYMDSPEFLVYDWSGESGAFTPITGEQAPDLRQTINIGDHNCRVDAGRPFPHAADMPSRRNGYKMTAANWAEDYAFFLDHSPAEIHPGELIVGEFHWMLEEARQFKYPESEHQAGYRARQLGTGGISFLHTCPDLGIGLALGWGGLLEKTRRSRAEFEQAGDKKKADYLESLEKVVRAIIRYVGKHADEARRLAASETDPVKREHYLAVAVLSANIQEGKPASFHEALQWIQFYQVAERIVGHGNGYGRLDQLLIDYYLEDRDAGRITRDQARELVAEFYLKYGGNYLSFGGRDRDLKDATNEMSWIGVEAYDLVGGYNHLGVMWHRDIDREFFNYACDVVARHGCGAPTLVNYDVMRAGQLYSGFSAEDSWNISYSGCQWYCSVGREYCNHDCSTLVLIQPMQRAMDRAIAGKVGDFEGFWKLYCEEVERTADALVALKNETYRWEALVWPQMVTSLCMHGPVERGLDVTDIGGVDNCYTSVNIMCFPNVVDSMYALKTFVFEGRRLTLARLQEILGRNWEGAEALRREILNLPKWGNDIDAVDRMGVMICEHLRELFRRKRNIKGYHFRISLFQYMGHTYAGPMLGATPDGRQSEEPIAMGVNPMHGRNRKGLTAAANSTTKIDYTKIVGGSLQVELNPSFFAGIENRGKLVAAFASAYFTNGGVQVNLNVIDLAKLKDAIDHPEKPEYQDIVIKVTGYSAHFVVIDRKFQEEFVKRANYAVI